MATFPTTGVASPWDADDTTYYNHTTDTDADASTQYAVNAMPGDFATMDTGLEYSVISRLAVTPDPSKPDTYTVRLRIMSGATVLAAADSGGTYETVNVVSGTTDQTDSGTFTYVNTTADATAWDNAVAQTEQGWLKDGGPDVNYIQVDYVTIGGGSSSYTAGTQNIGMNFLDSTPTLYQPTVTTSYTVVADFFNASPTLYEPTVIPDQLISVDLFNVTPTIYNPTVAQSVTANFLNASPTLYEPTVTTSYTITANLLDASPTIYQPSTHTAKYARAVGGNWSADATWSNVPNGAANTTAPTASDDVILDGSSGNVTIDLATQACRSLDCNSPDTTPYTGTLTINDVGSDNNLTIGDSNAGLNNVALRFSSGMTLTYVDKEHFTFDFISTSATQQTVTQAGQLPCKYEFNGAGADWLITDDYDGTPYPGPHNAAGLTLRAGSLDLGSNTYKINLQTLDTGTKTLDLGSASITIYSNTTGCQINGSNLTVPSNTATITFVGSQPLCSLDFALPGTSIVNQTTGTFPSLRLGGTNWSVANLTHEGARLLLNSNITITNTFTANGTDAGANRLQVYADNDIGTAYTITAATASLSNIDFRDITAAGVSSPWSGSAIGDCQGNTNITATSPVTRYAINSGTWTDTAIWSTSPGGGGGASVPLPQDNAVLDSSSGTGLITAGTQKENTTNLCKNLDMSNYSGSFNPNGCDIYGNISQGTGATWTVGGSSSVKFRGRSSHTIDTNNQSWPQTIVNFYAPGGTYTFSSDFQSSRNTGSGIFTVGDGTTLNDGGNNISVQNPSNGGGPSFAANSTAVLTGTWTVDGSFSFNSGMTSVTASSATLILVENNLYSQDVGLNGWSIGTITYTAGAAPQDLTINGGGTIGTLNVGSNRGLRFTSGQTYTFTGTFNVNGTAGNLVTIYSSLQSSQSVLSKASGIVDCNYLSIEDSNATGGASWYAGSNSTNVNNNTGWLFTGAPQTVTANLLDSTPTLYQPTVTTSYTITANLLDATPTLYQPTVTTSYTITTNFLNNSPTIYQPTVTTSYTITANLLDASPTLYQPTVATSYTVVANLLTQTPTLYQPQVVKEIEPGFLDASPIIYTPDVYYEQFIGVNFLDSTPTFYLHSVGQAVYANFLDASVTLFSPTDVLRGNVNVVANLLDATPTIYQPTVTTSYTVSANLLDATPTLYEPTVTTAYTFVANFLTQSPVLYQPDVTTSYTVSANLLDVTPTLYQPTVTTSYTVTANLLDATPTLYQPKAVKEVEPGFLDATATIYTPDVYFDQFVSANLFDVSPTLYAPNVGQAVYANFFDASPTIYQPTIVPGEVTIVANLFSNATTLHQPSITTSYTIAANFLDKSATIAQPTVTTSYTVVANLLDATPTLYEPTIATSYTVTANLLTNAPTLYQPEVIQEVEPGFLDSTATIFTPGVYFDQTVTANLLDTTPTFYLFDVYSGQQIEANFLNASPILYQPTVTVGEVTITANFLNSSPTIYQPTIAATYTITANLLTNSPTIYQPADVLRGTVTVQANLLDNSATIYQPTDVLRGGVSVDNNFLDASPTLYQPTVAATYTITANVLTQSPTLYSPDVAATYTIAANFIDNSATIFAPSDVLRGGVNVQTNLLDATPTIYQPDVSQGIPIGMLLLDATPTIYQPDVYFDQFANANLLDASPTIYQPDVISIVETGILDATPTIFQPTVTTTVSVSANFLDVSPTLYNPSVAYVGIVGTLDASPTLFAPTVGTTNTALAILLSVDPTIYPPSALWISGYVSGELIIEKIGPDSPEIEDIEGVIVIEHITGDIEVIL